MKKTIDVEPAWVNLVPMLLDLKDRKLAIEELTKIAKIGDEVRQAQKNKKRLVFDFSTTDYSKVDKTLNEVYDFIRSKKINMQVEPEYRTRLIANLKEAINKLRW